MQRRESWKNAGEDVEVKSLNDYLVCYDILFFNR